MLGILVLHVAFGLEAGGLWRDEAHTVALARQTAVGELGVAARRDAFPVLSTLALRVWTGTAWGASEAGLRSFGVAVGLALLAAFAVAARGLGRHAPLVSGVLLAGSPLLIRVGDSVRAYGLGMLLMLLTVPAFWRLVRTPSVRAVGWAAALAIASVQCLYQNAPLLLGVGLAAALVCLRERRPRRAWLVLGVGALAAASLLPYLEVVAATREHSVLVQTPTGWPELRAVLVAALTTPSALLAWAWLGAGVAAFGVVGLGRRRLGLDDGLALYCVATVALASIAYSAFLVAVGAYMTAWYALPLLVVVAACLNGVLGAGRSPAVVATRVAVALGLAAALAPGAWQALQARQTNLDRIAARLAAEAAADDLIVVQPWYLGVGFDYHYRGATPWTPLPPLADRSLHRLDLLRRALQEPDPIRPVLDAIERVLDAGHAVWVVDALPPPPARPPAPLGPAPHPTVGWTIGRWEADWALRTAWTLAASGARGAARPLTPRVPVQRYEDVRLTRFARP